MVSTGWWTKRRMLALREASKNMHPSLVLSPLSLAPPSPGWKSFQILRTLKGELTSLRIKDSHQLTHFRHTASALELRRTFVCPGCTLPGMPPEKWEQTRKSTMGQFVTWESGAQFWVLPRGHGSSLLWRRHPYQCDPTVRRSRASVWLSHVVVSHYPLAL